MKGPGNRVDLDVRRLWRCPRCGREQKAGGQVVSVTCHCAGAERVFMVLQPPAPKIKYVPAPREFEPVEDYELGPFERPPRVSRSPKGRFSGPKLSDQAVPDMGVEPVTDAGSGEPPEEEFGYIPGGPAEATATPTGHDTTGPARTEPASDRTSTGPRTGGGGRRERDSNRPDRGRSGGGQRSPGRSFPPRGEGSARGERAPRQPAAGRGERGNRRGRGAGGSTPPAGGAAARSGPRGPRPDRAPAPPVASEGATDPVLDTTPSPDLELNSGSPGGEPGVKKPRRRRRGRGGGRGGAGTGGRPGASGHDSSGDGGAEGGPGAGGTESGDA